MSGMDPGALPCLYLDTGDDPGWQQVAGTEFKLAHFDAEFSIGPDTSLEIVLSRPPAPD
jgi:hypothetical protein